jgi:CheY-like chemotaxis protein
MALALIHNIGSRSLECSNAFIASPITPAPVWGLPFASALSNARVAEFGLNPNPDEVRRFYLPSQPTNEISAESGGKAPVILLVEDNPADSGLIREALEEHGVRCELLLVTNGQKAIEFIEKLDSNDILCPDLLILDLNLPRRSGKEILQRMRMSSQCANIPIVVLTSSDHRKDREETAFLGASRYIRKPTRLDEFLKLGGVFKEIIGAL